MLRLGDIRTHLRSQLLASEMPSHVAAFCSWITQDAAALSTAIAQAMDFTGQARHPEHVAALGYGARAQLLSSEQRQVLLEEIQHLGGRTFFPPGRPPRFEVDGVALLGVSLGARHLSEELEPSWLTHLLDRSSQEVASDEWQLGLVRLARVAIGEPGLKIIPPDLAVAAAARGLGTAEADDLESAWKSAIELTPHKSGPGRDAARLAAFESVFARLGQVPVTSASRDDLMKLLRGVSRGMKRWTFEREKRTAKSALARWDIENEYHVQNLLWAVLAPVFPDIDDEENLSSIGQKKPRADLAILSLRTIIEVKFLRDRGQRGFAKVIEEIAADTSLYLSRSINYDNIIAFVWDDCAQTEQHHELISGLEQLNGVSAAIVIPRPSCMRR